MVLTQNAHQLVVDRGAGTKNILSCLTRLVLYKVVTLKKSNELTVIPATWLNEENTQCHWPPFKSPEKCTEAVKNRLEPPVTVEKQWETLNIQVHMECGNNLYFKNIFL